MLDKVFLCSVVLLRMKLFSSDYGTNVSHGSQLKMDYFTMDSSERA